MCFPSGANMICWTSGRKEVGTKLVEYHSGKGNQQSKWGRLGQRSDREGWPRRLTKRAETSHTHGKRKWGEDQNRNERNNRVGKTLRQGLVGCWFTAPQPQTLPQCPLWRILEVLLCCFQCVGTFFRFFLCLSWLSAKTVTSIPLRILYSLSSTSTSSTHFPFPNFVPMSMHSFLQVPESFGQQLHHGVQGKSNNYTGWLLGDETKRSCWHPPNHSCLSSWLLRWKDTIKEKWVARTQTHTRTLVAVGSVLLHQLYSVFFSLCLFFHCTLNFGLGVHCPPLELIPVMRKVLK